jgi:TolB protein
MKRVVGLLLLLPWSAAQAQGLDIGLVSGNEGSLPIVVVPMPYQGSMGAPGHRRRRGDPQRPQPLRPVQVARARIDRGAADARLRDPLPDLARAAPGLRGGRAACSMPATAATASNTSSTTSPSRNACSGLAVGGRAKGMRDAAHQIADQIYEKILGVRGAFWTRVAYVTASGFGQGAQYALMVADSDGFNPQNVVRSREPLLSPAVEPGRAAPGLRQLRARQLDHLRAGNRHRRARGVASFRGINGAPAFSPDGRRLALTLSKGGNPEIYVMDLGSKALTQVTRHYGIDTEPVWTPDGRNLLFTSDRAGKPQVYRCRRPAANRTRVSFQGESNARATVSFDGKKIAMARARAMSTASPCSTAASAAAAAGRPCPRQSRRIAELRPQWQHVALRDQGRTARAYSMRYRPTAGSGLRLVTRRWRRPRTGLVAVQAALMRLRSDFPHVRTTQEKKELPMNKALRVAWSPPWPSRPSPAAARRSRKLRRAPRRTPAPPPAAS